MKSIFEFFKWWFLNDYLLALIINNVLFTHLIYICTWYIHMLVHIHITIVCIPSKHIQIYIVNIFDNFGNYNSCDISYWDRHLSGDFRCRVILGDCGGGVGVTVEEGRGERGFLSSNSFKAYYSNTKMNWQSPVPN